MIRSWSYFSCHDTSHLLSSITDILHKFETIFAPQLASHCIEYLIVDHRIHLVEGTKSLNVRPCWYPRFQKSEMEKFIREMLDQWIIIPSHRFFFLTGIIGSKERQYMALLRWLSCFECSDSKCQVSNIHHQWIIRWTLGGNRVYQTRPTCGVPSDSSTLKRHIQDSISNTWASF